MAATHHPVHAAGLRGYAPGALIPRLRAIAQFDILQTSIFTLGSEISTAKAFVVARVDPFNMVRDFLFCGGPSVGLKVWLRTQRLNSEAFGTWPQLEDRTVIGTHRGRTAVALACHMLGLGAGHEVLVPSYHCGTELDALLHAGVTPVAYRVTRHCEIDLEDLIARKTDRTRAGHEG